MKVFLISFNKSQTDPAALGFWLAWVRSARCHNDLAYIKASLTSLAVMACPPARL